MEQVFAAAALDMEGPAALDMEWSREVVDNPKLLDVFRRNHLKRVDKQKDVKDADMVSNSDVLDNIGLGNDHDPLEDFCHCSCYLGSSRDDDDDLQIQLYCSRARYEYQRIPSLAK